MSSVYLLKFGEMNKILKDLKFQSLSNKVFYCHKWNSKFNTTAQKFLILTLFLCFHNYIHDDSHVLEANRDALIQTQFHYRRLLLI